MGFSI